MVGQPPVEACAHVGHAEHVDQELGQFKGRRAEEKPPVRGRPVRSPAATGRSGWSWSCNCRWATTASTCFWRTSGSKMSTKRRASGRFIPEAGVEGGLAAAGLLGGEDDLDTVPLQQLHRRHAHLG